MGDGLMA